jgi:hypothetical protein
MTRLAVFASLVFLAASKSDGQVPDTGRVSGTGRVSVMRQTGSTEQSPPENQVSTGPITPEESVVPGESTLPLASNAMATGIIAPRPNLPQMASAGEMIGFSHVDGSGNLTITLVHTGKSWMSVYYVDSKGTIRLASSRPIDADFTLQLNATDPLPEDIRQMADRVSAGR